MSGAPGRLLIGLAVVGAVACGKKGPPLPPVRPVPGLVTNLTADRLGDRVTLRFVLPAANADGTTPVALDRVEIYAMNVAASGQPPTTARMLAPENLVGMAPVKTEGGSAGASTAAGAETGSRTAYVDRVPAGPAAVGDLVRYYAAVGAVDRRRGVPTAPISMPLFEAPLPPNNVTVDYDERTLTIRWTPVSSPVRFLVYETDAGGTESRPLSADPIEAATFTSPVELGRERCFAVRSVFVAGAASTRGEASAPVCVAFDDRFAPPVPTGLLAVAADGGVDLVWSAVEAPDLAGYLVLRGDGPNGTLQRLTVDPLAGTKYRDTTVKPGATYVYAVVALDRSVPPNVSEPSSRQVVTVR